ncbi:hypothetical protein BU16DRAFT_538372 [Lophium mytilinum]|uniref:Uncharacterized protein n=1 Tax=Lophium mytilinum TaxID=390894 RepID=A0A6A6QYG8_9PEZI|nr:hypothetical protein BU16DRAFT_538372 [Lophium mytilinum]
MDKLKKILSPSQKHDDQVSGQGEPATAGAHHPPGVTGALTGEGSHLGAAKGSEIEHPIYDQFTHNTTGPNTTTSTTTGTTTSTSSHPTSTGGSLQPESLSRPGAADQASTIGVKDGIMGHPTQESTILPDRTAKSGNDSWLSNTSGRQTSNDGLTGDRAFPLAGGVSSTGQSSSTQPSHGYLSNTEARRGEQKPDLATAAAQTAYNEHDHEHAGHGHTFKGDPCSADEHHATVIPGPHGTDTANRLDPHVPGAFPDATPADEREEPGFTSGSQQRGAGLESAGVGHGRGIHESDREPGTALSSDTRQAPTSSEHHYGRDAALVGGGAAGAGGLYEATKHHNDRATPSSQDQSFSQGQQPISEAPQPHALAQESIPQSQDPSSQHHYGRDAGLVGGGAAATGGLYEANKHHNESAVPTSQSQPLSQSQQYQEPLSRSQDPLSQREEPSSQHHYGRDAALVGGGAAGAGGLYEANKHHNESAPFGSQNEPLSQTQQSQEPLSRSQEPLSQREDPSSQHHYGRDAALGGGAAAGAGGLYEANKHHHDNAAPTSQNQPLSQSQQPLSQAHEPLSQQEEPTSQHHYGRDAALVGGGAAGAGGLYEANKHRDETVAPGYQDNKSLEKETKKVEKQHEKEQKKLDREYKKDEKKYEKEQSKDEKKYEKEQDKKSGGGLLGFLHRDKKDKTSDELAQEEKDSKDHHYGRDAAVVGGAGALGAGAYEANRERQDTGPASKTIGPHDSNAANILDPRVQPEPEKMKDRTTAGPHDSNIANKLDPRVKSDPAKAEENTAGQHHYGRDAAVAGGAGAAGVGAYEAGKHHGDDQRYDPSATSGTGAQNTGSPEQHQLRHTGQLGAGQGGDEALKQHTGPQDTTQSSDHHYGRDAALAGGAGAVGAGEYEANKHSGGQTQIRRDDPSAFGGAAFSSPTSTTSPTSPTGAGDSLRSSAAQRAIEQHREAAAGAHQPYESAIREGGIGGSPRSSEHHGRDAALGAGAIGAGGLGAHEYDQHRNTQPSSSVGEQRYDPSSTRAQDSTQQHHYGRDAALVGGAGATGLGADEAYKHYGDQVVGGPEAGNTTQSTQQQPHDSHLGRDAALGGGALGAGAVGAHELSKHDEEKKHGLFSHKDKTAAEPSQSTQQAGYGDRHSHTHDTTEPRSHKGEYAAAGAGVGAAGVGAHELSKHDNTTQEKGGLFHHKDQDTTATPTHHEYATTGVVGGMGSAGLAEKHNHGQQGTADLSDPKAYDQKLLDRDAKHREEALAAKREMEEKEAEKQRKKESKGGLFGFLHRDKDKHAGETTDESRRSGEYGAAGAGVGAAGIGAGAYEADKSGRNKLHKDPPANHPAAQAGEGYGATGQSTGLGSDSSEMHPGYGNSANQGVVTEPHTGLPMNVGKYGDGAGGTDGNTNIAGATAHQGGERGADWEGIKKANTPY